MGKRLALLACTGVCIAAMASAAGNGQGPKPADLKVRGGVHSFATLPERGVPGAPLGHPEGLCADAAGNIYANTFDFGSQNYIYVFDRQGKLISSTPTPGARNDSDYPVAPLGCTVSGNKLYVNDVVHGNELVYTLPLSDNDRPYSTLSVCGGPFGGAPDTDHPQCFLNANYVNPIDKQVYISDNGGALFGDVIGRIWVLNPETGLASRFIDNPPELKVADGPYVGMTPPVPSATVLPFSANGVAFSRDGSALYIANMSTNKIYKQPVANCNLPSGCERNGGLTLFSSDPIIQGPDNMDFDDRGNLWIASGQNNHVVVLNSKGDVAAVFGNFEGFEKDGAPKGLLQPSGIIFANGTIYVGNESNPSLMTLKAGIDFSPLRLFTISRISAEIPDNGK